MAAPARLRLMAPFPLWLMANLAIFLFLLASIAGVMTIAWRENQGLAQKQLELLLRTKSASLLAGNYRDFSDSLGKDLAKVSLSIREASARFQFGEVRPFDSCAESNFRAVTVQLCRRYDGPKGSLIALVTICLLLSLSSLFAIRKLEFRSINSLRSYVREIGIRTSESDGLFEILTKIRDINGELLEKRRREIELEKSRAVGELAAEIVHDIRSPLNLLKIAANQVDPVSEEIKRMLLASVDSIQQLSEKMLRSVRHSAALSHIEGTYFLIGEAMSELIRAKQFEFRENDSVEVKLECSLGVDPAIRGDRLKFTRMISNLINNAVEAKPVGCVVTVKVSEHAGKVFLTVKDNGPGFCSAAVEGFGLRGKSYGKIGGTGLGLFQAKRTAIEVGADLQLRNQPGVGAEITIGPLEIVA